MKFAAVVLVALAVASTAYGAPKQIVIAPPPPPAAQSGIGPGLCNQVLPGPRGRQPYSGTAVVVTGFLQWQNFPGMTEQDKANAVISRDANEYFLQNNAVGSLNTAFPGIEVDCSCNPFYIPKFEPGNDFIVIPETNSVAGVPYASCTIQPKESLDNTVMEVGIDNGKMCPTGPQYIIPVSNKVSGNLAGTGSSIVCLVDYETYNCRITGNTNTLPLKNMMAGQHIVLNFFGLDNTDSCTETEDFDNQIILQDYEGPITFVGDNFVEIKLPRGNPGQMSCTNNQQISWSGDVEGAEINLTGKWSPLCDSDFAFYKANNPIQEFFAASEPTIGFTCPACASSSGTNAVLFNYNGPNKGKYCSKFPLANGVYGVADYFFNTNNDGTSCIMIGVDASSPAINGGKAMLTTSPVYIVPLSQSFSYVAIDTQMNVPCSTPSLSKAPTPGGIVGLAPEGTCNTISTFSNGGTKGIIGGPDNGIPLDTDRCAILSTVINGPLAPGASPPVVPSPAVSPKPVVPSPAVGPSPVLPPLKCTYSGVYRIKPYYAPCVGKYIAWASPSNCSNTVVNLRSTADLGGKLQRAAWALKTSATGKVGVPTPILAPKGECAAKHLAAPSNPSNGLKLGGDSWKWQVVPAEGTKTCDMVNLISENRIKTTAFLSVPKLNNKQCAGKFAWAAKDGGRQRFRITKV